VEKCRVFFITRKARVESTEGLVDGEKEAERLDSTGGGVPRRNSCTPSSVSPLR